MNVLGSLLGLALTTLDALFEALTSILRVLFRGAFEPDARSFRGDRFALLSSSDVLIEEIALNAGDRAQARKAIALDPERFLPLGEDAALFDVAGPIDQDDIRARPERTFILGIVRKQSLERARDTLSSGRRNAVERFVFAPSLHSRSVLQFEDEQGAKRRKFRRAALLFAMAALAYAVVDAHDKWSAALDRSVAQAAAERLQAERRIRVAQRRVTETETALASLQRQSGEPIGEAAQGLSRVALHLSPESELMSLQANGSALTLSGRSFAPDRTELELRRAFEGARIDFTATPGPEPAQAFEARVEASGAS